MGVNFILAFVLVTISYIHAQEYVILDETDFNDWDTNEQNPIFLDERYHVIHKREAPETDLEGSGDSDLPIPVPEDPVNKTSTPDDVVPLPDNPEEQKQEEPNGVGIQISNFVDVGPAVNVGETSKANETKTETERPIIVDNAELETAVNKTNQPDQTEEKTTNPPEQLSNTVVNETTYQTENPQLANNDATKILVNVSSPTEKPEIFSKEQPVLPPLIHSVSNETTSQPETTAVSKQSSPQSSVNLGSKTDVPSVPGKEEESSSRNETKDAGNEELAKVTPQVMPSDLAEVESINKGKESESVNDQQSGIVVMLKVPKSDGASQVEGSESEKALQGMAENAKISNEPKEQPATGESAKNVSRAGKDTTILVVLFVVVIAIGGAAFTHNYIKKRKQNASSNNDIVNEIRRSLQNLSSSNVKNNPDVEQGTELKPLMKENSPITVTKDYTDTRKEVQA